MRLLTTLVALVSFSLVSPTRAETFSFTAVFDILGIATLGSFVNSAFDKFQFYRAALLILASALRSMAVDTVARNLCWRLHFVTTADIR